MNNVSPSNIPLVLQDILNRPGMYIGPFVNDIESVVSFLSGFNTACEALGIPSSHTDEFYLSVVRERGWSAPSTRGIWTIMREQGMGEESIIRELLTIELEVWKKRIALSNP
jgi:hypothetical protein